MPELTDISAALSAEVGKLRFAPPVTHVYDPLAYARAPHVAYLARYGRGTKEALFLGMNPGPFGMAQTGVPFGDVALVRDFLGIDEPVEKPPSEHPKRPVEGFACARSEVSGSRLWGLVRERFGTPERFFERFFVWNYCPLLFLEESGKNRTPDKLPASERAPLLAACDAALVQVVERLRPRLVIGVGAWAKERASEALRGHDVAIATILHPSPASPRANKGWAEIATKEMEALGLSLG